MRISHLDFVFLCIVFFLGSSTIGDLTQGAFAQQDDADALRAGKSFLATPVYTLEQDRAVLALFDGLRVADV